MPDLDRLTHAFDDAPGPDRDLLGGKGAGLVEMVGLELPVPPGFVITTACGRDYLRDQALPGALDDELRERMGALQAAGGRTFGDERQPMLVSVRSGAPVSMPGMMDTILNVGLTEATAEALAEETGDELYAFSCLYRLLDGFARTVRDVNVGVLEEALMDLPDADTEIERVRARCSALLKLIEEESGEPFPEPEGQLRESTEAVFRSWNSRRAKRYRRRKEIDDEVGTAVVVQLMVFGNRGEQSGSGVAFTRDPSTGASGAYGDFLFAAQGEDVVSGEHDTETLDTLGEKLPDVHEQLVDTFGALERHFRDMCDVEFTVEDGKLWILQTRVGQRSGRAAVRIAVAMVEEELISQEEAVERVNDEQLESAKAPRFEDDPDDDVLGRGVAASPGAAVGAAVFSAERAQQVHEEDDRGVVLVRPTTSTSDYPGLEASVAVVTGRGGRMSHAAVVARGEDLPAVCGIGEVRVADDGSSATIEGVELQDGDALSVDGDRGIVARGERELADAESDEALTRFLEWRDGAG